MGDKQFKRFFRPSEAVNTEIDRVNWLQRTIAICIKIGISKKEFMEDYYIDEIPLIMQEYAELSKIQNSDEEIVAADDF